MTNTETRPLTAIGLMSGTSLDGIDAAILVTDGTRIISTGASRTDPYSAPFRDRLRGLLGRAPTASDTETIREFTLLNAHAVTALLADAGMAPEVVDVIGFHGQTVMHRPDDGVTVQIGDGRLLAAETGIDVVSDFRTADVAAGGEGAPFAPLYHAALAGDVGKPLAVLNIGGVANATWIGDGDDILAFDTGPGNALIDDWMRTHGGGGMDAGGAHAAAGRIDEAMLTRLLDNPYHDRPPPKSLDRNDFADALTRVNGLSVEDGAATLTAFTARSVALARTAMPAPPVRWLVCGGGRHNPTLMAMLRDAVAAPVDAVETVGWNGDALEAQAFAFLAVRSLLGLPLSLPTTTGVDRPRTGGVLHRAPAHASGTETSKPS